jgi:hypothetical protein
VLVLIGQALDRQELPDRLAGGVIGGSAISSTSVTLIVLAKAIVPECPVDMPD